MANWTVNDIMKLTKFLTKKNQSGSIRATDLFYAWNTEQASYHQDIVGRWQRNNNGKTGSNTGLIQDQTILTDLSPFTLSTSISITSGNATKPSGFIYALDLRINGHKVTHITSDQIDSVNNSVIDPPSTTNSTYYFTEYEDYYYLLPHTVTGGLTLDYVAECRDIVWGYTLDGDGRQVYDAATSVQPQWNKNTIITITKRTLDNFGVSYKDADFTNFGKTAQMTGD